MVSFMKKNKMGIKKKDYKKRKEKRITGSMGEINVYRSDRGGMRRRHLVCDLNHEHK